MSLDVNNGGYISAGSWYRDGFEEIYGLVMKASESGDSLWMRKFLPLDVDEDSIYWARLEGIKATPSGEFIAIGRASVAPIGHQGWMIKLDSDGCLIPNCGVVGTNNAEVDKQPNFRFHPNPVEDKMYIQSLFTASAKHELSIVDLNGHIVKNLSFTPSEGVQYIIDASSFPAGSYFLSIQSPDTFESEVFKFVKL